MVWPQPERIGDPRGIRERATTEGEATSAAPLSVSTSSRILSDCSLTASGEDIDLRY